MPLLCEKRGQVAILTLSRPEAVLADLYRFAVLEMTEDRAESPQAWRKPEFKGR